MANFLFWSAIAALAVFSSAVCAVPVDSTNEKPDVTVKQPEVPEVSVSDKVPEVQKPVIKEIEPIEDVPKKSEVGKKVYPQQYPTFNQQWFPFPVDRQGFNVFNAPFPMMPSPFHRLFQAYNQEFKAPEVIIINPKQNSPFNRTSIPPIPMLMNIMLNAFRPTDILSQFEKDVMDYDSVIKTDSDEVMPKAENKTTTRTEIIDGHVVQINETTYTSGDENNKSFFHFKKIHVLPQNPQIEQGKPEQPQDKKPEEVDVSIPSDEIIPPKVPNIPMMVNDQFQMAAANYLPYAPFNVHTMIRPYQITDNNKNGPRPSNLVALPLNGNASPAVSLAGDTLVNELAATQQQASGLHELPPDVEIIDVHGKPQKENQGAVPYLYNTIDHSGYKKSTKFPGYKY
ncbi:uncharacterized protein LOC126894552 isoform X1 [Daktulosphaira vitifoliae]|uniref:uncharacterized protein LOC126894552 isoform X1 n=1 Tax=Daktulosphaira vitifoliae TaxID=58002 RepID=UPI0021A9B141|nr:uncharacterized protein LOC126894552 isoform X1 [Daktulosphaira vitifoliae]